MTVAVGDSYGGVDADDGVNVSNNNSTYNNNGDDDDDDNSDLERRYSRFSFDSLHRKLFSARSLLWQSSKTEFVRIIIQVSL